MYRSALFVPLQTILLMIVTLTAVLSDADATFKPAPDNGKLIATTQISLDGSTAQPQVPTSSLPLLRMPHFTPAKSGAASAAPGAPVINPMALFSTPLSTGLLHNFNGLSDLDNARLNGFLLEPPDQGLCVGNVEGQKVVVEMVNLVIAFYTPSGTRLLKESLATFFNDDSFISDPRCTYDNATNTFFFTQLGTNIVTENNESHLDVAVLDAASGRLTNYRFNTTDRQNPLGDCPCLDDQPHLGIDSNAIYVSADEFSLRNTAPGFNGSELLVISKDQLLGASSVVKAAFFRNLALAGIPVITLMPAISESASDTEYLLNSFPYDQLGNPIPFTNVIGYWSSTRDNAIASGIFPVLTAKTVVIEKYAFPVLAGSTPPGNALNPNDDRISQVEFINGQLWSTIETAIHLNGEIVDRDGAAWFELRATSGDVINQGYVAARGEYLIYPTILHAFSGLTTVNFTVTSPSLNPSAGFVNLAQPDQVRIAAKGSSPYETVFFRWGDYSAAALDPNGMNIWMANEYVPPRSSQTDVLNWGTRVFEQ